MADFKTFAALIRTRFEALSKHELFTVEVTNDALWLKYLSSFPEGTNPVFRERTEHDCSCCKQFIRNIGNVVAIIDGKMESVWDVKGAGAPYDSVSSALDFYVKTLKINNVYRKSERSYGTEKSFIGEVFYHFNAKLADKHYTKRVGETLGDFTAAFQVSSRGLKEIEPAAVATALELIDENGLYRGTEFRKNIADFQTLQTRYAEAKSKSLFVWEHIANRVLMIRNTAIGTFLVDLSEDMPLDQAVRKFEAMIAPANYKRTTAPVSTTMVQKALKTIEELGLEPALKRRFARISDVSVNNVLFVDNELRGQMKGSLSDLLMSSISRVVPPANSIEDIDIGVFMANIVPKCTSMELMIRNEHQGHFMSLTAPVEPGCKELFKWNNDFAWAYKGDVTDSIKERVKKAGGSVTGVMRVSLGWHNADDLDLAVRCPDRTSIFFGNKGTPGKTGVLDVDMNAFGKHDDHSPVENITWSKTPADGEYHVAVNQYQRRTTAKGGFSVEIEMAGVVKVYSSNVSPSASMDCMTITIKNGVIDNIKAAKSLTTSGSSTETWGVKTEALVKVNTIMTSPNHWDGQDIGNKHWFFILEGCSNPEPVRGIYNEYLRENLQVHRKVFELLGEKTKCPVVDDQLSGLGFSSTQKTVIQLCVKGESLQKTYNVWF